MSVNGVTNSMVNAYQSTATTTSTKKESNTETKVDKSDAGAVYEPSSEGVAASKTYSPDSATVARLQADLNYKTQQMQGLVDKLLGKQTKKVNSVLDLLKGLKNGSVKVDAATAAQAQSEISEDGYWGVNQTSDRLVEMAKALSGGDASKADTMINAIKKGLDQATKAFGSKLPDICSQTIDAATDKLNQWKASLASDKTESNN